MSNWMNAISANTLVDGEHIALKLDGIALVIFKIAGQFYALENICTHDGAEIANGVIEEEEIICPRHGARFCIKTGAFKTPPAYENINSFPTRIDNGQVQIYCNN